MLGLENNNIWYYRNTIRALIYREINQRYKQAAFGWLWSLIRPLLMAIVFTFIFGNISGLYSSKIPYILIVFSGLLPWELFSNVLIKSTTSIIRYKKLVTNISTPKYLFPLVASFSCLFEFIILFIITLLIFLGSKYPLNTNIIFYPLFCFFVLIAGLSIGIWLATFTIWFRDIKFAIGNFLQILILITPVGYSTISIPKEFSFITDFNPLTVIMDYSRFLLLGINKPPILNLLSCSIFFSILLITGFLFFDYKKSKFVDIL